MSDGEFTGDAEDRLRDTARRMRAAVLDGQARDWTAERPDRVGWARLEQTRTYVTVAADRYGRPMPTDDMLPPVVSTGAAIVTVAVFLLLAGDPAAPLTLAGSVLAAFVVAQTVLSALGWIRSRRHPDGSARIDDPYLYADLNRRIEAAAAVARADPRHATAADDLDQALIWLGATRDTLTGGPS